jgi:hypothetical protein
MNFKELVNKYSSASGLPVEPIVSPAVFGFSQINKALLFVLAPWSATSIQAFQALLNALNTIGWDRQIFVINIEDLKQSSVFGEIEQFCEGNGELFWISNGKVLKSAVLCNNDKLSDAVAYTKQFVKEE